MTLRITTADLEARIESLNHRMESRGSRIRYQVESRNGSIALDRVTRNSNDRFGASLPDSVPGRGAGWMRLSTVTVGTKREVGDFLHAMMVALDDARES